MGKIINILVSSLILLSFAGCSSLESTPSIPSVPSKTSKYIYVFTKASIAEVERPENIKNNFGEIKTTEVEETKDNKKIEKLNFEDELIGIAFWFNNEEVQFVLKNKSKYTIKVIWDDAAFIDLDKSAKRVIHSGIKLSDAKNTAQIPSIIIKNGYLEDLMVPVDNIYYDKGYYGTSSQRWIIEPGWKYKDLFKNNWYNEKFTYENTDTEWENKYTNAKNIALEKMKLFFTEGKNEIGILLPIEFEGVKNEYIFKFKVTPYLSEK